jgi:hypothetical protein
MKETEKREIAMRKRRKTPSLLPYIVVVIAAKLLEESLRKFVSIRGQGQEIFYSSGCLDRPWEYPACI